MKKFAIGLAVLIVVLVAAALVVPSFIDWNRYKPEIAAQVKSATGRDLRIEGDLSLSILPSPALSVDGVRFANLQGAAEPDMARLKALRVKAKFGPLLTGRLEVESVALIEPQIVLERFADGRVNWDFSVGSKPGDAAAPGTAAGSGSTGGSPAAADAVKLEQLRIVDGTVIYRDAVSGSTEKVTGLNAELSAASLKGPFTVSARMGVRKVPIAIKADIDTLRGAAPSSLRAELSALQGSGALEFAGSVQLEGADTPQIRGRLKGISPDLRKLVREITAAQGSLTDLPAWTAQKSVIETRVEADAKSVAVNELTVTFGDATATGGINIGLGGVVQADVALKVKHLNLDRLGAGKEPASAAAAASTGASGSSTASSAAAGSGPAPAPFALPAGLNGSVDFGIEAITYKEKQVRDVRVSAVLNRGELTLNEASLRLPGGTEAALFGFVTSPKGQATFDGSVDIRSDNIRNVLEWVGSDVSSVPADRLRKLQVKSKLRADQKQVQVFDTDIRLDASRILGGVTFALTDRLSFGASLDIDHVNLDAYVPASAPTATPATAAAAAASSPDPGSASPQAAPLAKLNDFDANLALRIGTLNYRQSAIQGVRLDGTLLRGTLTMREASVRSLAGTSADIKGTLTGFDGIPVFKGSFGAASNDISGLLRLAGIEPDATARELGQMKLTGTADAKPDSVKLVSELQVSGGTLKLTGDLAGLPLKPTYDIAIDARHPELLQLSGLLPNILPKGGRSLGPLTLVGTAKGRIAITAMGGPKVDSANFDAKLNALGSQVAAKGSATDIATKPNVTGGIDLSHPDFVKLVRLFDPAYRPAGGNLGALALSTTVNGAMDNIALADLKTSVGKLALAGSGSLNLAGAKPEIVARLKGGDIDLNPFLPAGGSAAAGQPGAPPAIGIPPGQTGQGTVSAGQRYSRVPLDVSTLDTANADIDLTAASLTYDAYRVDQPEMKAVLKDRVLTVSRLAGKMFDGAFAMLAKIDGNATPTVDASVNIAKANIKKALFQAKQYDIADGILDFDMSVKASGKSEAEMVAALDGNGKIAVRNGVIKGFDLPAVSARLKQLDRASDFLSLFATGMQGGSTPFTSLDGTIQIRKGVVRTDDLKLIAAAGEGTARGGVDLPRWNTDIAAQFRLTEHPKAPPFGVEVKGPPDQTKQIFRFEELQAYLLQRGVGRLLEQAIPGLKQKKDTAQPAPSAPAQQPAAPQKQEKIKPEDILKDLLKGLKR